MHNESYYFEWKHMLSPDPRFIPTIAVFQLLSTLKILSARKSKFKKLKKQKNLLIYFNYYKIQKRVLPISGTIS